jgi:D-alanine-D-alanine ligase
MKKTLLILFGGRSGEYEVSLVSAAAVIENVPRDKYDIVTVGITREGKWFLCDCESDVIRSGGWTDSPSLVPCALLPDYGSHELITLDGAARRVPFDAAMAVIHGTQGEDGQIQGLFELSGAPLVGCSAQTSANCMDKATTKLLVGGRGVASAPEIVTSRYAWLAGKEETISKAEEKLGYPMFVKPSRAGSSVGVTKAHDRTQLEAAVERAIEWDSRTILIEKFIPGREVEVAVLVEGADITVSVPGEIDPGSEFYDYDTKYKTDTASYYVPARVSESCLEEVRKAASAAAEALGIEGLSRIDFFVTEDEKIIMNEVNTMPGFTPISMYPKLMANVGVPFSELIDRLVTEAIERVR